MKSGSVCSVVPSREVGPVRVFREDTLGGALEEATDDH
jgi:hypothetical protein